MLAICALFYRINPAIRFLEEFLVELYIYEELHARLPEFAKDVEKMRRDADHYEYIVGEVCQP